MEENVSRSGGYLWSTLLGGLATGVVIGILYAPDKGRNTRKKLADNTRDMGRKLRGKISEETEVLRERAYEIEDQVIDRMEDLMDTIRVKADAIKDRHAEHSTNHSRHN
jgi:gas vesicle protein